VSRPVRRIALCAAALALAGSATAEAALIRFATPSRNIGCIAVAGASIRCDIRQTDAAIPRRPAGCEQDWGNAYEIGRRAARGRGVCAGDTALPAPGERIRIVAYGATIRIRNGLRCTSTRRGLTCLNLRAHGFFLSKQKIRLF